MSAPSSAPAGGFRYYLNMLRRRPLPGNLSQPCRAGVNPPRHAPEMVTYDSPIGLDLKLAKLAPKIP